MSQEIGSSGFITSSSPNVSSVLIMNQQQQQQNVGIGWKTQLIDQLHQRDQRQAKAYGDVFLAYSRLLQAHRALKTRVFQLEQEVMTTRSLSSLAATPSFLRGPDGSLLAGGNTLSQGNTNLPSSASSPNMSSSVAAATIKMLEEKVLKCQEDLTAAYRLQAENGNTQLRLKEQSEKDERALIKKDEELAAKTREVISLRNALQAEKENSITRNKNLETTCEMLRTELQSTRGLVRDQETKLQKITIENDRLLTELLKLKEQSSHEQNELNEVRQELLRANAEAKEAKKLIEDGQSIQPTQVDLSDVNSLVDHVAWTSSVNVMVPNERKRTIRAHRGPVTCLRYNTAGTLLASAGTDGIVKVYDARSGANRASLRGTKESVMNVAFNSDDSLMLVSGNDMISRVWSLKNSRIVHTLVGHTAKIWAASFTGDGTRAVTGSHDRTVKLWDIEEGACKRSILCQSSCNYLSLSRNDGILATAHLDAHVRFWSPRTGELMQDLEEIHQGQATSVEFSRDGQYIVTCSRDNTVKITDIRTYKVVKVLEGSSRSPFRNLINWNRAIFSPDDAHIVVGGHVGELFFWNVASGKLESILPGVAMSEGIYGATPATASLPIASPASSAASISPRPSIASNPNSTSTSSLSSSAAAVAAANTVGELHISCVDWNRNGRQVISCDHAGNIHCWEHDGSTTSAK